MRKFRTGWCAPIAVVIVLGCMFVPAVLGASTSVHVAAKKTLTPLQRGLNYYKGKTITIAVSPPVGGSYDAAARVLAPTLESYLHATVVVDDYGNGSVAAQEDYVAHSTPDGLTLGPLNIGSNVINSLSNTPWINFNPQKEDFLGNAGTNEFILVAAPSSHITSIKQIINTTTTLNMPTTAQSVLYAFDRLLGVGFHIPVNLLTAYGSTGLALAGFLRGDGPIFALSLASLSNDIITGAVVPLLVSEPITPAFAAYPELKNVPTLAEFAKQNPPKSTQDKKVISALEEIVGFQSSAYFVPPKTPSYILEALRKGVAKGFSSSHYPAMIAAGLLPGFVSASDSLAGYVKLYKIVPSLKPYFNV